MEAPLRDSLQRGDAMSEQPKRLMDPARVTPEGRLLGAKLVEWFEPHIEDLVALGNPDERCKTCAFRLGTIPNGCPQTQMEVLKCVMEQDEFHCHARHDKTGEPELCHGWVAAMDLAQRRGDKPIKCAWPATCDLSK